MVAFGRRLRIQGARRHGRIGMETPGARRKWSGGTTSASRSAFWDDSCGPTARSSIANSIDASPYGIAFSSDAGVQPNERIVAYLNQIGRVEGRVARIFPGGFAIQMNVPPAKRDKLATQLAWLANRQALGLPEDRRHERIAPRDRYTILQLPNGREYTATLIDISMSGAALNVDCEPPIGARVIVGATPAEVVRHVNCGIAVEFLSPLPAEEFGESTTI